MTQKGSQVQKQRRYAVCRECMMRFQNEKNYAMRDLDFVSTRVALILGMWNAGMLFYFIFFA